MAKMIRKPLMAILQAFRNAKCKCKKDGLYAFVDAIGETGVWLLNDEQQSIKEMVDGLRTFKYTGPNTRCSLCSQDMKNTVVGEIIRKVMNYFEGLCLDCMDSSKPRTGDRATDYWLHNVDREWDADCRMSHKRNTWYHSYMGRPEEMQVFKREMQDRKKTKERADREQKKKSEAELEQRKQRSKETNGDAAGGSALNDGGDVAAVSTPSLFG
jgi:hypothetical protein